MIGIIIKDDKRYDYTENYFKNMGHHFVDNSAPLNEIDFIIFPFKNQVDITIYNNSYFSALKKDVLIFSGIKNDYLALKCAEYNLKYFVMMDVPEIAAKNAVPTSEGVIAHLISSLTTTIANSKILIIGYGICGSDLAKRLKNLDAEVFTLVRNKQKESLAKNDNIIPIYINNFFNQKYNAIINTVPSNVITDDMIIKTNGTLMLDIASSPYGFNMNLAKSLNPKSALLPALPGKYAVKTSGEILAEYIENILRRKLK